MLTLPLHAEEPDPAQIAEARAAVKDLGQGLKVQLMAAIKAGGPVSAIGVCQIVAPALSKQSGGTHGLKVGRTALRIRNPANAPDAYERKVLEEFVAQIDAGASADKLESAEIILDEGTPVFRYMKPIPMGTQPCLTCHGSDIDPALKAEIGRLYPDDEATGFKPGQLRGAFTVSGKAQ
jgi:hypothetical protein